MFPRDIEDVIRRVAEERGLRVGLDTHYDAMNCEVSWWRGRTLHRVDFQPTGQDSLHVTLYRDVFPNTPWLPPRLRVWAHNLLLPGVPCAAKIEWSSLGDFPYRDATIGWVRETLDKAV